MPRPSGKLALVRLTLDQLRVEDERSFRHLALYAELKEVLVRAKYPFRVLPGTFEGRADRALLLNLTFWTADAGGDVLDRATLPADVVTHAAFHHLAATAFPARGKRASASSMFLGEAIASSFDVYLVGRLLGRPGRSTFLETQVPAMAETAAAAGLSARAFERLLEGIAADPERAFEDLRQLLFDATTALHDAGSPDEGLRALAAFDGHRFAALLHRYELSNWALYARAYGSPRADARVARVDRTLREERFPLAWLVSHWVKPALAE
ncbi:MAG: hypothetical protein JWP97_3513 [Labilithrix sp.]|nr:hypothetical protein [Labilithrix sp.]